MEVYQKTIFSPILSRMHPLEIETYKSTHNLLEINAFFVVKQSIFNIISIDAFL